MIDASAYTISVRHLAIDEEFVFEARVAELPDIREYAETSQGAYELAIDSIQTTAAIFAERGWNLPKPVIEQVDEVASGRLTLRVPKSLHARLIRSAATEGVSLNQYIVSTLSVDYGRMLELSNERYSNTMESVLSDIQNSFQQSTFGGMTTLWAHAAIRPGTEGLFEDLLTHDKKTEKLIFAGEKEYIPGYVQWKHVG